MKGFDNAWRKFKQYYETEEKIKAMRKEGYFDKCWNERDVISLLYHFLLEELNAERYDVHTEVSENMDFSFYPDFDKKWKDAWASTRPKGEKTRRRLDLVIFDEKDEKNYKASLIIEVKFLHEWRQCVVSSLEEQLNNRLKELRMLKKKEATDEFKIIVISAPRKDRGYSENREEKIMEAIKKFPKEKIIFWQA